jgi:hypothetical protein
MMVTTVRGKFDLVEGELELDEAEPTNSKGEIPGVCRQPLDRSGEARRRSPFGRSL